MLGAAVFLALVFCVGWILGRARGRDEVPASLILLALLAIIALVGTR